MRGVAAHENDDFQLSLAVEELVEEVAEPGYGEEGVTRGVLDGDGQKFGEMISNMLLKTNCSCYVIIFCHVDSVKCVSCCREGVNKTFFKYKSYKLRCISFRVLDTEPFHPSYLSLSTLILIHNIKS